MWSTWSTTVAYDTRFRTDDVVNVIFKFCQISILLLIAGYTNYFDVAALGERPIAPVEDGSSDDDVYFSVFTGQAWSGMALAFAIGKYLAALQRGYVLVWARIIGRKITPALVLPMLAPFITAIAWTAVRELRGSTWSGADKLRYCVAFLSLGIEIGVSILTARLRSGNVDTIVNLAGERFRLLTLLVLGEGAFDRRITRSFGRSTRDRQSSQQRSRLARLQRERARPGRADDSHRRAYLLPPVPSDDAAAGHGPRPDHVLDATQLSAPRDDPSLP